MIRSEPGARWGTRWIADIADCECVYPSEREAINAEQQYIQYLKEENRRLKQQLGAMK